MTLFHTVDLLDTRPEDTRSEKSFDTRSEKSFDKRSEKAFDTRSEKSVPETFTTLTSDYTEYLSACEPHRSYPRAYTHRPLRFRV